MLLSSTALWRRSRDAFDVLHREIAKFGAVGLLAFVVDVGVFNILRTGGPLADKPLTAKVVSVCIATVVAWLGNRYWTFRHRRRAALHREFILFGVMNVGGLLIALGCLGFSHYLLGLDSPLADNISGNGFGLVLGTLFRFWAYRTLVFTEELSQEEEPAADAPPASTATIPEQTPPADGTVTLPDPQVTTPR